MEASNDYAAVMEARLVAFPDKEEIAAQLLTIQKLRVELEAACAKGQESSSEIEILEEKLARAEQEKLAAQGDAEVVREKCKRVLEGHDAAIRKESRRACDLLWKNMASSLTR